MLKVQSFVSLIILGANLLFFHYNVHAGGYYDSGWFKNAGLSLHYDNNVSRSDNSVDVEEDFITTLRAGAGYQTHIADNGRLIAEGNIDYDQFGEFTDLNNISISGTVTYALQPVLGFTNPWYEFSLRVSKLEFNDSDIRDGEILELGVNSGKRFTDRIIGRLGYFYEQRFAEGKLFDTADHLIELDISYSRTKNISFYGLYSFKYGDAVSTATPSQEIISVSEAVAADDVFIPGIGPGCLNRRCAWRIAAEGYTLEAGVEINFLSNMSFNLSSRYFYVDAAGDNSYRGMNHRASLYIHF